MHDERQPVAASEEGSFRGGAVVLLTLHSPREKIWGMLVELAAHGVTLRGISLDSFEDLLRQVKAGEPPSLSTSFFPMHRVERIALDQSTGEVPSLAQQMEDRTGRSAGSVLREETR